MVHPVPRNADIRHPAHREAAPMSDPFAVLGLPRTATAADVRAARRRLSKRLHPDALVSRGEDERRAAAAQLADVNRAVELALAALRPTEQPSATQETVPVERVDDDGTTVTFAVDGLPVEAFEPLLLALSAIGDPKVVDEPYLLEGMVDDPALCLCRIELAPEAGGTSVTVEIRPMARSVAPPPPAIEVAGRLVAELEALGRE
jgi:hypothetical protein